MSKQNTVPLRTTLTEGQIMRQFVKMADTLAMAPQYADAIPFLFHPANEGNRGKVGGAVMQMNGLRAGVPDIMMPIRRYVRAVSTSGERERMASGLALEFKAAKGHLSDEQRAWLAGLRNEGWCCYVVRDAGVAYDLLKAYLDGELVYDVDPQTWEAKGA